MRLGGELFAAQESDLQAVEAYSSVHSLEKSSSHC